MTLSAVAITLWIAAAIAFAMGAALLFPGSFLDQIWQYNRPAHAAFRAGGRALGSPFLALGLLVGIAAVGLMRGKRWAWRLAIAIFAVNGLGDVVGLWMTRDLIRSGSGVVVAAAFLSLLLGRNVRRYVA